MGTDVGERTRRREATGDPRAVLDTLEDDSAFAGYGPALLTQLVDLRMEATQTADYAAYRELLRSDARERQALIDRLQVGHTSFFRDASLWPWLANQVVNRSSELRERRFRIWSAGCASGEELYTLAMLLAERIGLDDLGRLWMFGTDASHSAIERARRGHYSAQQLATVPRRLRDTYFARGPDGFTVRPALRNRLMFARHDLLRDPPFSRLDLIVCRNTLIYFASTARRRILSAFHYTLRADGLLVLGQDERANVEEAGFELIRPDGQVFRRLEQPQPYNWLDYGCSVVPPQGFPPAAAESRKVARRNEGG